MLNLDNLSINSYDQHIPLRIWIQNCEKKKVSVSLALLSSLSPLSLSLSPQQNNGPEFLHIIGINGEADMGTGEQYHTNGSTIFLLPKRCVRRDFPLRRGFADQVPAGEAIDERPPFLQEGEDLCTRAVEDGGARALRWGHRGYGAYAGKDRR